MLHNFCPLAPGDWLIQNGANSAVGQAVIQIAAAKGYKTINLVRNRSVFGFLIVSGTLSLFKNKRDNISELRKQLEELGADKVATYDDLRDLKQWVPEWTEGKVKMKTSTFLHSMLSCPNPWK
jgi:NADPH:quinone reductase-like Zn-dependent oxidoreductase